MGKDSKPLGVNKAALAGGRNGKGTGRIPLTGNGRHKSQLGVNKPVTAGGRKGKSAAGAGLGGAQGAGGEGGRGLASTLSPTDGTTSKKAAKVTNECSYEEENCDWSRKRA